MINEKLLDQFIVLKTLGRGRYSKVKAVKPQDSKEQYAAKIFFHDSFAQIATHEASIMRTLNSPLIVRIIDFSLQGTYYKKDGSERPCMYILMELCSNSDLLNLSISRTHFSLDLIKFIFLQILSAVEFCHQQGVSHQDLKPQNILFDENFSVKLSDFGSARSLTLSPSKSVQASQFSPPEANRRAEYSGEPADVFSLGSILFYMFCQCPAFHNAGPTDALYRLFLENPEHYWARFSVIKKKDEVVFTQEFKELMHGMMNHDPLRRMGLSEVKQHRWLSLEGFGADQVREEVQKRRSEAQVLLLAQKENRKKAQDRFFNYRGLQEFSESTGSSTDPCPKHLQPQSFYHKFTQVQSYLEKQFLFTNLQNFLVSLHGEIDQKDFMQLRFSLITEVDCIEIKVVLYEMEDLTIVEFKYLKGCYLELVELVKKFEEFLAKVSSPNEAF